MLNKLLLQGTIKLGLSWHANSKYVTEWQEAMKYSKVNGVSQTSWWGSGKQEYLEQESCVQVLVVWQCRTTVCVVI